MLIPIVAALVLGSTAAPNPEHREPVPQVTVTRTEAAAPPVVIQEIAQVRSAVTGDAQEVVRERPAWRTLLTIVVLAVAVGALIVVAL